jgi:hypothetical protein
MERRASMSSDDAGLTVGSGDRTFGTDDIDLAEREQEKERVKEAYRKGKARHDKIQEDPAAAGGPSVDGYENMNEAEKEAYKKGFRGE